MDRAKKIALAKTIISTVATIGAGVITSTAISNNTPTDIALPKKASVVVGGFVLGVIVKDAVAAKTGEIVDKAVALYDKHSKKN
jgi:hypothetical protein